MKFRFYLMLLLTAGCATEEKPELITLDFQKDLFPEGIAVDGDTETIFLNSLRHGKIVKCNLDGSFPQDFVKSHQYGYQSGFGMMIKGDTLFALGNTLPNGNVKSILLLLNKKTGDLINSYSPADSTFKYLNDLAVCRNGDIYITDSESNKIYTIQHDRNALEIFLDTEEVASSNGIAVSDDNKYLYLASYYKGIRVVDLATKQIINKSDTTYTGIDGMKYHEGNLFAIVNSHHETKDKGVYKFHLNPGHTEILKMERLLAYQEGFDVPTTFSILNGYMYFNINSQMKNYDEQADSVRDETILKPYKIMKLKID